MVTGVAQLADHVRGSLVPRRGRTPIRTSSTPSPADGHVGLHILATVHRVVVSVRAQVFAWTCFHVREQNFTNAE